MAKGYVLARGEAGANRLAILNEAMWPSSRALLRRAGLRRGMHFLDVGCGAGDLTQRVAALGVVAHGVDADADFITRASAHRTAATFSQADVSDLSRLEDSYDVVYARYLLSHLADPARALRQMASVTRRGGAVVLEDTDFHLHVAHPRPPAFDRYLELYEAVIRRRGGNPIIGRELFGLATRVGLEDVQVSLQLRILTSGPAKRITTLTLSGAKDAIVAEGTATAAEIDALLAELDGLESDPTSQISVAGTYQVWGRRAAT